MSDQTQRKGTQRGGGHSFGNRRFIQENEYMREFTGCCQPTLTWSVTVALMDFVLLVTGIAMLAISMQILDKTHKFKKDDDCDKDTMIKVEDHVDMVQYFAIAMIVFPVLSAAGLCFLWSYIGGEVEQAVSTKQDASMWVPIYDHVVHVVYWYTALTALVFAVLNSAMAVEGYQFWDDVEKADDDELCAGSDGSRLDRLSDRLKYALIPCFTLACIAALAMCCYFVFYYSNRNKLAMERGFSGMNVTEMQTTQRTTRRAR